MRGSQLPPGSRARYKAGDQEVEEMRARAVWSRIRYFTPQQRFRAAQETRSLRTLGVFRNILAEACDATRTEPNLAEEWATFSIQLLEMLPSRELPAEARREKFGEAYTVL